AGAPSPPWGHRIDVIEMLEAGRVLDFVEHRKGVTPFQVLGNGGSGDREADAVKRGSDGGGEAAADDRSSAQAHATLQRRDRDQPGLWIIMSDFGGSTTGSRRTLTILSSHSRGPPLAVHRHGVRPRQR